MKTRLPTPWRAALLALCLAALLVAPVAARQTGPFSGPDSSTHRLFLPMVSAPGPLTPAFDLIDQALANGTIDSETALVYKIFAIFGDSRLPPQYRGQAHRVLGGTEVITEAITRYPTLSPATQRILVPFLLPAYYEGSWQDQWSPGGAGSGAEPAFAAAPQDAPPHANLSFKWYSKGNDTVKVWGRKDIPGDERQMDLILSTMTDTVWPKLTTFMGRLPLSDANNDNNGGDGRFDITLASLTDYGLTYPYDNCRKTPAFLVVNRNLSDTDLRATLAHEFMHAIQFTYNTRGDCADYSWMMESTATWTEDYVYPQPNTEQEYLSAFLDYPPTALENNHDGHPYGAYLFPFYLSHRYSPNVIRQMWEATEQKNGSLAAIDSVIQGGFKQQWPEFARYNWNRLPQDDYRQWDNVPRGMKADDTYVALLGSEDADLALPGDIPHLAAQYYHFVFPDAAARSIAFYNPFFGSNDPAIKVQALVKIGGTWGPVQDWTPSPGKAFCRDMKAERLEELLVVISNSSLDPTHVLHPYEPPRLVATNIGCWRWSGTAVGTYETKGYWTMTTQAQVTFERVRYPAVPDGTLRSEFYSPIGGNVVWQLAGASSDCTFRGGPTTVPIGKPDASLEIKNYLTSGPYWRTYSGSGAASQIFDYTVTCPTGSLTNHWSSALWFGTNQELVKVSDDGSTLDASVVTEDDAQFKQTMQWHLTAEREP